LTGREISNIRISNTFGEISGRHGLEVVTEEFCSILEAHLPVKPF